MLKASEYDLRHWNCSNVCKFLLLNGINPRFHREILEAAACTPEELFHSEDPNDLLPRLRILATSPFIDCRPDDLRRIVGAYNKAIAVTDRPPDLDLL